MTDMLVHQATKAQLDRFLSKPSHALLLSGPKGSEKKLLGRQVAAELLQLQADSLDKYPYFLSVSIPSEKQNIPIESIREIIKQLQLRISGKGAIKRVVLIEDADAMTDEAQNALLKSLEEPPQDSVFILTANSDRSLLPTVASRTTKIIVRPVSLETSLKYFKDHEPAVVESAWNLSHGYAGLLTALLGNETHELKLAVGQAKKFVGSDKYSRLVQLDSLSSNKAEFDNFLLGLAKVLQALYKNAAKSGPGAQTSKLTHSARLIIESRNDLSLNVAPKLIVLRLALNLHV